MDKELEKLILVKADGTKVTLDNLRLAAVNVTIDKLAPQRSKVVIEVVPGRVTVTAVEDCKCDICGRTTGAFETTKAGTICTKCKEALWT